MPDVHNTPAVNSDDQPHVLDRTCWCQPEVWQQLNGDDLIVHKTADWSEDDWS